MQKKKYIYYILKTRIEPRKSNSAMKILILFKCYFNSNNGNRNNSNIRFSKNVHSVKNIPFSQEQATEYWLIEKKQCNKNYKQRNKI